MGSPRSSTTVTRTSVESVRRPASCGPNAHDVDAPSATTSPSLARRILKTHYGQLCARFGHPWCKSDGSFDVTRDDQFGTQRPIEFGSGRSRTVRISRSTPRAVIATRSGWSASRRSSSKNAHADRLNRRRSAAVRPLNSSSAAAMNRSRRSCSQRTLMPSASRPARRDRRSLFTPTVTNGGGEGNGKVAMSASRSGSHIDANSFKASTTRVWRVSTVSPRRAFVNVCSAAKGLRGDVPAPIPRWN